MTQPTVRFQDHVGLVHQQAKFGFKWADGAGTGLSYDDMFQVASVAFVIAANSFDPTRGIKFSTYYTQAAFSEFRREIGIMTGVKNLNVEQRAEIAQRKEENALRREQAKPELMNMNYGLRPVSFADLSSDSDDGWQSPYEDTLASDMQTPEEIVAFQQVWDQVTADLSPLATLMVEWLRNPPPELMRELAAQDAYATRALAAGKRPKGMRDGVSVATVKRFMALATDAPKGELLLAEVELERVMKKIEEIYAT